jgi:hypothetical protein
MATYLSLVNNVLTLMREDTVSSVGDTDYSTLIGNFVNLVKEEMEDAANWDMLRSTIQVATVDGTWRYGLTGAGSRAKILDVFNDTEDVWLYERNSKWMTSQLNTAPTTNDSPMWYNINGIDSNGDLQVDVYPVPDGVDYLNFNMVIPEDTLSDDTDVTNLPTRALKLGTWAMAISERGEDGGSNYREIYGKYMSALADAIALDASHHSDEYIMETV